jgi:hypothetical protein
VHCTVCMHARSAHLHMLQPVACTLLASPPAHEPQKPAGALPHDMRCIEQGRAQQRAFVKPEASVQCMPIISMQQHSVAVHAMHACCWGTAVKGCWKQAKLSLPSMLRLPCNIMTCRLTLSLLADLVPPLISSALWSLQLQSTEQH